MPDEQQYPHNPGQFAVECLGLTPDPQQTDLLSRPLKRVMLNCTRQWGKSTITAALAVHRALTAPESLTIVVSPTGRQSGEFLRKAKRFTGKLGLKTRGDGDNEISLMLPNKSRIVGLPGTEATVRGFSAVSLMLIDEAARVPDELYKAVRPMLAVGGGDLLVMSTPFGQRGFFWDEWTNHPDRWERVSVPATACPRIPASFLEEERAVMGEHWFRQEYLCEFVDTDDAMFRRALLDAAIDASVRPLDFPTLQSQKRKGLPMLLSMVKPPSAGGPEYLVGVDLGQKQDFTAIAVIERTEVATGEIDAATYERRVEVSYLLRYLERVRLGTPYPEIVGRVRELVRNPQLEGRCTLVVDATGVGVAVVDMLRQADLGCPLVPVMITGGGSAHEKERFWHVPKRDLVVGLQVMFEQKQLRIAAQIPETGLLLKELSNMRVKVSDAGHDSYAGRDAVHDDLVLAVALACWRARRKKYDLFGNRSLGLCG